MKNYNQTPIEIISTNNKNISVFNTDGKNIDKEVVETFGEEWLKFNAFSEKDILVAGNEYFDILNEKVINKDSYILDIGCGTGRWSKYLSSKVGFIEAIDPSNAVFAANKLLENINNIRITKASVDNIPFEDNTFDFAMSIGVLHHIPDTQQAMKDAVKKVKIGGYFYCYLYYNLESRGFIFKNLFALSTKVRNKVSKMKSNNKKIVCDLIAIFFYMPFVIMTRILNLFSLDKISKKIPLNDYSNKSFFIIRNDALDRFGTTLEQRFSKKQVIEMMENSGLKEITVSNGSPFYHAIGKRF
jgi:ubiquinone/menaquinone biosynthesis C-methylase UbiE